MCVITEIWYPRIPDQMKGYIFGTSDFVSV
jgi:hypothetical protein